MEAMVNSEPAGAVGMEAEDPSVNVYLAPVICLRRGGGAPGRQGCQGLSAWPLSQERDMSFSVGGFGLASPMNSVV